MSDIRNQVLDVISEALNVEKGVLSDDLSIGGIPEWDSVGNLAIISAIEEKMEIEIPLDDLFDLTSITALVEEVEKLKA
jgi:acyl carrier protein